MSCAVQCIWQTVYSVQSHWARSVNNYWHLLSWIYLYVLWKKFTSEKGLLYGRCVRWVNMDC